MHFLPFPLQTGKTTQDSGSSREYWRPDRYPSKSLDYPLQYWKELWVLLHVILGYPSWVLHKMLLEIRDDITCHRLEYQTRLPLIHHHPQKLHRRYVTMLSLEILLSKIYVIPSCLPNLLKEQYNYHQFPTDLISFIIS